MGTRRSSVRVALYCAHPGCSEGALVLALRSRDEGGAFVIAAPRGWYRILERDAAHGAPYDVPALCPRHGPDVLARSLADTARALDAQQCADAQALQPRLARCLDAIERWRSTPPSADEVVAIHCMVAELRAAAGLTPGASSGVWPTKQS